MKQVLQVEGMSCAHCVASIEGALKEKEVQAKVDLEHGTVEVEYPEQTISLEEIKETIEDLGYDIQ
jgi:copper chaperone